ncbi:MAG: hypothetical protein ACP5QP_01040 [Brevinematia bacterium]
MNSLLDRYLRYSLYFLIFGIFVFSPFDIVLNFRFSGFNFRFVVLFYLLFMFFASILIIKDFYRLRKIYFPLWFIFLLAAGILNLVFVFNLLPFMYCTAFQAKCILLKQSI